MQEKIFEILFERDEITWQSIIYELVRSEQMNPWNIDVSLLTQRYMQMLSKLKELDFRISGKVLLAAALLLKIKSNRLVDEDIQMFDKLFAQEENIESNDLGLFEEQIPQREELNYSLIHRTPQPRKRKVSIYDLVKALEKALEVSRRRILTSIQPSMKVPVKPKEVTQIIKEVYARIMSFFTLDKKARLTFSKLIPSDKREDKVYTFIPLLHLANQHKIELLQEQHFGEIEILLRDEKGLAK